MDSRHFWRNVVQRKKGWTEGGTSDRALVRFGSVPNWNTKMTKGAEFIHKGMLVTWWRLSPRRACVSAGGLLAFVWLSLFLRQTFHPDYLLPSTRLFTVPFSDYFWLDLVAGDYFQARKSLVAPLPGFRLLPKHGCKESSFLVVLVTSPATDLFRRKLIRDTWAGALKDDRWPRALLPVSAEVFFVLGISSNVTASAFNTLNSQLVAEEEFYDDLIIGDFTDTYRNLTLKTLTGLNWVRHHCHRTDFVMKLDQDTLVDFPRLTDFLFHHRHELHSAIIGKLYFNSKRRNDGKWKVGPEEYPMTLYPTFAGGPCYIISTDVVAGLVNMSQYLPFFVMEDVHVTGTIAKSLGVRRLYMQQLQNWKVDSPCVLLNKDKYQVSMTDLTGDQLRRVWEMLVSGKCQQDEEGKSS